MKSALGARPVLLVCLLAAALWTAATSPSPVSGQAASTSAPEKPLPDLALPGVDAARRLPAPSPETSSTLLALPAREKPTSVTLVPGYSSPGSAFYDSQRVSFRIGYLTPADESSTGHPWFQDLKQALERDPAVRKAMADGKISGVALRPCDHPEDMLQRMLQSEFDLVFCPAMVYVHERIAQANQAESSKYRVLFRTLRPGSDSGDSRTGEQIRQRGILFVRKGSALGESRNTPGVEEVKTFLRSTPLAVSGSYDAAGYFYVRKMLWEQYDRCEPGAFLYFGSPQEAVNAVVSGLCDAGACEESVLREVLDGVPAEVRRAGFGPPLDQGASPRNLVRAIKTTMPVPTDPIVIHERYMPAEPDSERSELSTQRSALLGLAVRDALRRFYQERGKTDPSVPRLEPGMDAAYDPMEEDVRLTRTYGW